MIITGKKFSKPSLSRVKNGDVILPGKIQPEERIRLDLYLVEKHPEFNRSTLQNFIKSGYVTVGGEVIKKTKLRTNQKFYPKDCFTSSRKISSGRC